MGKLDRVVSVSQTIETIPMPTNVSPSSNHSVNVSDVHQMPQPQPVMNFMTKGEDGNTDSDQNGEMNELHVEMKVTPRPPPRMYHDDGNGEMNDNANSDNGTDNMFGESDDEEDAIYQSANNTTTLDDNVLTPVTPNWEIHSRLYKKFYF